MNELLAKLKAWYGGLQQREQRVVAVGALALATLVLVLGVLLPLQSAVTDAVKRLTYGRDKTLLLQQDL